MALLVGLTQAAMCATFIHDACCDRRLLRWLIDFKSRTRQRAVSSMCSCRQPWQRRSPAVGNRQTSNRQRHWRTAAVTSTITMVTNIIRRWLADRLALWCYAQPTVITSSASTPSNRVVHSDLLRVLLMTCLLSCAIISIYKTTTTHSLASRFHRQKSVWRRQ